MRIEMPTGAIDGAAKYRKLVAGSFAWAAPVSFDVHHLAVDGPNDIVFADWTIRARRRDDDVRRRVARPLGVRATRRPDQLVARASPRAARRPVPAS